MNRDLGVGFRTIPEEPQRTFAEKRRHPRRQLRVRCWMGDGSHTVYVRLHDLSLGGLSVRAPVPFAPESELEVALVIGGTDQENPSGTVLVRARGRVVWVRPVELHAPSGPRMGAQFMTFVEGEPLLRRLLESR